MDPSEAVTHVPAAEDLATWELTPGSHAIACIIGERVVAVVGPLEVTG